jgi:hypothetical protein
MNGHEASYMFAIKCFMVESPYLVMANNLILSMFYFGYLMRIFDSKLSEESGQNFDDINNPVWMSIVTMTTVGYGDFFPKSTPSRIIGIMCAFYGVFQVSLFVIALDNLLVLSSSDERSYTLIQGLGAKDNLKLEAVNVITTGYRHKKAQEKNKSESFILGKLRNFRKYLLKFSAQAKTIRAGSIVDNPASLVREEIGDLRETVIELRGPLEKLKRMIAMNKIRPKLSSKHSKKTSKADNASNEETKSGDASLNSDSRGNKSGTVPLQNDSETSDDASENGFTKSEKSLPLEDSKSIN